MNKMVDMQKTFDAVCKYFHLGNAMECNRLHTALEEAYELTVQPEPLTDIEQRIFLAAIYRELKVCKKVDEEYAAEYEDNINLVTVCREIERKVKKALWMN